MTATLQKSTTHESLWVAFRRPALERMRLFQKGVSAEFAFNPRLTIGVPLDYDDECTVTLLVEHYGVPVAEIGLDVLLDEGAPTAQVTLSVRVVPEDAPALHLFRSQIALNQSVSVPVSGDAAADALDTVSRIAGMDWARAQEETCSALRRWLAHSDTDLELARRAYRGSRAVTVENMQARLADLGYGLNRAEDTAVTVRLSGGPACGERFPAVLLNVHELDTGVSAWANGARRDENFERLCHLRARSSLFFVENGRIHDLY